MSSPPGSPTSSRRWIVLGTLLVVLVVGGGTALYFALRKETPPDLAELEFVINVFPPTPASCVALSVDGNRLATGYAADSVILWDLVGDTEPRSFSGHVGYVTSVGLTADGKGLLTTGRDGPAFLWNTADGKKIHTLDSEQTRPTAASSSPES